MASASADRGEVSTEIAILAPVLFALSFSIVNMATFWMSARTASAAATRGARAASMGGDARDSFERGVLAVDQTVGELAGRLASPPKVELTRQGVRVTVETEVTSIVPFVPHLVRRSAEMPRESYVMEIDR